MKYILSFALLFLSLPVLAQKQIEVKNLPEGIKQYGWTIEGHDNLVMVDCYRDFKHYYGVYNIQGREVIPCIYPELSCYPLGISIKGDDGKYGVISYSGEVILKPIYSSFISLIGGWDDGYRRLNLNGTPLDNGVKSIGGKWGACDKYGNIVVPCIYDDCHYAGENLFTVNIGGININDGEDGTKGGKWGLYGDGRELLPCIYDERLHFRNGVASLKKDGEIKLIKNPLKDGSQIQIASGSPASNKKTMGGPAFSRYPAPDSDVDKNIPTAKAVAENTFAFIIANENYPDAPVPYSLNDGRMFRKYCQKTLGLPAKNINIYEDATYGNIITAVEKMKQIAEAYDGEASVIFYYAGHGFPDEKQSTAYLLPIDGNASDITSTGYSLAKFYEELAALKLKSSVVFLDACFSGAKREDEMLASARGVAIKVKTEAPQGNMLVFSAAQGDETAHQMEEKHHGLFTYYLLKELQATGGDVDLGTLTDYVTKQVKRQSVVINNKRQTPTVIPSQALQDSWRNIKLK